MGKYHKGLKKYHTQATAEVNDGRIATWRVGPCLHRPERCIFCHRLIEAGERHVMVRGYFQDDEGPYFSVGVACIDYQPCRFKHALLTEALCSSGSDA